MPTCCSLPIFSERARAAVASTGEHLRKVYRRARAHLSSAPWRKLLPSRQSSSCLHYEGGSAKSTSTGSTQDSSRDNQLQYELFQQVLVLTGLFIEAGFNWLFIIFDRELYAIRQDFLVEYREHPFWPRGFACDVLGTAYLLGHCIAKSQFI